MNDWTKERIAEELHMYESTRKYAVCGRCMGHGEYEEGTGQPSDEGGELSRVLTCEVCQGTGAHPLGVGTGDAIRALSAAQEEIARLRTVLDIAADDCAPDCIWDGKHDVEHGTPEEWISRWEAKAKERT